MVLVREIPVSELHVPSDHPRRISAERRANLLRALERDPDYLWRRPILANETGAVYAGVQRFLVLLDAGWTAVPAVVEPVPDQMVRERRIRDNQSWAEWDEDALAVELDTLGDLGADIDSLGFQPAEVEALLARLERADVVDPDAVPEVPAEPVTGAGDAWRLGSHVVVCGDSTDPRVLDRAFVAANVKTAAVLWTDPPYGVDYVGKTRAALTIQHDDANGLSALLTGDWQSVDHYLKPGAAIFCAHPAGPLAVLFFETIANQGWQFRQDLVWVKDAFVLGHADFHYQHEGVAYARKPGPGRWGRGGRGWYGGNALASVFEVPRPAASPDHPTTKPVGLVRPMLQATSRRGEVVLDPFLGSGSTLIAAEQTGRRCIGIEIDSRYVDVAVRRWETATGATAERIPLPSSPSERSVP